MEGKEDYILTTKHAVIAINVMKIHMVTQGRSRRYERLVVTALLYKTSDSLRKGMFSGREASYKAGRHSKRELCAS